MYNYENKLDILNYVAIVNSIAKEHFNDKMEYQPHYGLLNAMRIFYNFCVTESPFDEKYPHNITEAFDMEEIVADQEFIDAFYDSVWNGATGITFGNAFNQAVAIVETKKSSINVLSDQIKNAITDLLTSASEYINEDNLQKLNEIAKEIGNGKLSAEAVVEAYGKSDRAKQVMRMPSPNQQRNKKKKNNRQNVVPAVKK